ncbi:MAG TPA: MucR family transcriptional regulator [Caulobacteraceae bacterium]|nr:MucR family transcriptional regulator [Caulobacteraceae bacterium]
MTGTLELTASIVTSFVHKNRVTPEGLPDLIATVHRTLVAVTSDATESKGDTQRKATAAQIRRSITAEALISFEDGKPYRLLKRHLNTRGLTPQQYREKWGLPPDYPMTAPSYAGQRSELAKAAGLGTKTRRRTSPSA